MRGLATVAMLVLSNVFMTFAWYGSFKLREIYPSVRDWPLFVVILFSWGLAFFEYCVAVPANRIGHHDMGGPFNLMQLKVLQESVSLLVFVLIVHFVFKGEPLHWNHFVALFCLVLAVFFAFLK
ncbi:MAG: DMT family protein [Bacteroidales bacterium]|nr:DMT family protein [Bacteroidales bacterium]